MSQEVICNCCNGEGNRELKGVLLATVQMGRKLKNFSPGEMARALKIEHTSAHHRIYRLVELGAFRRVVKFPARYEVV